MTVRDEIQAIIQKHVADAVNEAIGAYKQSLDDGIGTPRRKPGRPPGRKPAKPATAAKAAKAPSPPTPAKPHESTPPEAPRKPGRPPSQPSAQATTWIDRVLTYVGQHPGETTEKILKGMDARRGSARLGVADALVWLRKKKKVKTVGHRRGMIYFL